MYYAGLKKCLTDEIKMLLHEKKIEDQRRLSAA